MTQFNFLVETSAVNNGVNTILTKLERRSNRDYKIKSKDELKIAFGLVIEGYKVIDARSMKVHLSASILDENGKELVSSAVETFDTITEWKDMPTAKRLGPETIIDAFSLSENNVNAGLVMPVVVLLDSFEDKEIPKKNGSLRVTVKDDYLDSKVIYEEKFGIIRLPVQ